MESLIDILIFFIIAGGAIIKLIAQGRKKSDEPIFTPKKTGQKIVMKRKKKRATKTPKSQAQTLAELLGLEMEDETAVAEEEEWQDFIKPVPPAQEEVKPVKEEPAYSTPVKSVPRRTSNRSHKRKSCIPGLKLLMNDPKQAFVLKEILSKPKALE